MIRNIFIALNLFCLVIVMGCDSSTGTVRAAEQKTKKLPLVQIMKAKKQSISSFTEVTGDVTATNKVVVRATVEGPIVFCPWREGDTVKKGEQLIKIDRPMYRAEMQTSKAFLKVAHARLADLIAGAREEEIAQAAETVRQLESCAAFTKTDTERVQQLVKTGALPEENLEKSRLANIKCDTSLKGAREKYQMLKTGPTPTDLAVQKALVQEAEAKLAMAQARLDECLITAPFNGVVTKVDVRPGDLASARSPLLSLMENASIVVRFSVPESQSYSLNKDTPITVSFDALAKQEYSARIVRFFPEIDPQTRTRVIEAKIEESADLVPGMFARVMLTTKTADDSVVLPDRAILTTGSGETVAFVANNKIAEKRKVTLGIENGSCIQIIEGIRPGEMVIVAGHEKIKNNAPVKVVPYKNDDLCSTRKNGGHQS